MLDDWRGFPGRAAGGRDRDASFDVRCAYDDKTMYVAVDVRDDEVRRSRKARVRGEDNLAISLWAAKVPLRVRVFPAARGKKSVHLRGTRRAPRWLSIADTLQQRGWSVELAVPLRRIRGWSKSTPGLRASILYLDSDRPNRIDDRVRFRGSLGFSAGMAVFRSFLDATGLSREDVRVDVMADVNGSKGAERVVAGGNIVGVISDRFAYMTLPVQSPSDVLEVEVVDLRGDGTSSIVTHHRERGNGGSRDVVSVWTFGGRGSFDRLLAFEVRKQLGERVLENRWSYAPRGKYRKGRVQRRGRDIVVEAGKAIGWDEDNWGEMPANDVQAILLPWEDRTSAVWYFDGNAVMGGDPKVSRRR